MKHIIEHNRLTLSINISIIGGLFEQCSIGKIMSIIGWSLTRTSVAAASVKKSGVHAG